MGSHTSDREFVQSLEPAILELVKPLEAMLVQRKGYHGLRKNRGLELIVGELTMVALLISNVDWVVQPGEATLVNELHANFFVDEPFPHASSNSIEFLRRFSVLCPGVVNTLDHPPLTLRLLLAYDLNHQSEFSDLARSVFSRFADAVAEASDHSNSATGIVVGNYQAVLQAAQALQEDIDGGMPT